MNNIWLFGEMEVSFEENPEAFFKRACHVAECCGYVVTKQNQSEELGAYNILIHGEDSPDNQEIINYVNVWNNKIDSLQKVFYTLDWHNKYENNPNVEPRPLLKKVMRKVYKYHKVSVRWKLDFDADKFRQDTQNKNAFVEVI